MATYINPKCRLCRALNQKLFLKGERCYGQKCSVTRRAYGPGVHGPSRKRSALSEYGRQLREKKKIKSIYGLLERQFRRYYQNARAQKGNTADHLLKILETRLDNVVYRLGLTGSRRMARHLISHGHILVNKKKVDISSYQVKAGEEIKFKEKSENIPYLKNLKQSLKKYRTPSWLELDAEKLTGKVVSMPEKSEVELEADILAVIDFYSR